MFVETVQRKYAFHHRRERGRNHRVAGVGPMLFPIYCEFVDRGSEGAFHLGCGSGKLNHDAAVTYMHVLKAMGLQPIRNLLDIAVRWAELLPELLWRLPLAGLGRGFFL